MTEQQASPKKHIPSEFVRGHHHLLGKVVLLMGKDTAVLQTLVTQLAQKGADIALVCRKLPSETLRRLRESVELLGRQFLYIEESQQTPLSANQFIRIITAEMGRLDIWIDLTAQKQKAKASQNGNGPQPRPTWQLMPSVVDAITSPT